jgi:hypothetical protein
MLAANNLAEVFDYLFPLVAKRLPLEQLNLLTNKQNGTGNTPLRKTSSLFRLCCYY